MKIDGRFRDSSLFVCDKWTVEACVKCRVNLILHRMGLRKFSQELLSAPGTEDLRVGFEKKKAVLY